MIDKPVVFLLFGPPGCGKGTQAAYIADRFQIPSISTGELFRAECHAGTRLGKLARSILSAGRLVPDEVVNQMLAAHLKNRKYADGFLLDGYPRTVPQAQFLTGLLAIRGFPEPLIIHLDVPDEVLVPRLCARRQCPACGHIYNLDSHPSQNPDVCDHDGQPLIRRADDEEPVIRQRLQAYQELTGPVVEYYAGSSYHRIDGAQLPTEVSRQIETALLGRPILAG